MKLKTFNKEIYDDVKCCHCEWAFGVSQRKLQKKRAENNGKLICPNCNKNVESYRAFPNSQCVHIIGGMLHFIESYNNKIKHQRHIFPPECYLPIIFACSNYETLLVELTTSIMNKYGDYMGRIGKLMVFDEVLSKYDRAGSEKIFKYLTGVRSVVDEINKISPDYYKNLLDLYRVRNNVVHGKQIDNHEVAFENINKGIDSLVESIDIFRKLNNKFVAQFKENIDYAKILRIKIEDIDL